MVLSEHLFEMDVSGQAKIFRQAFINPKCELSMGLAKEAVIVALSVQKSVDVLGETSFSCSAS